MQFRPSAVKDKAAGHNVLPPGVHHLIYLVMVERGCHTYPQWWRASPLTVKTIVAKDIWRYAATFSTHFSTWLSLNDEEKAAACHRAQIVALHVKDRQFAEALLP